MTCPRWTCGHSTEYQVLSSFLFVHIPSYSVVSLPCLVNGFYLVALFRTTANVSKTLHALTMIGRYRGFSSSEGLLVLGMHALANQASRKLGPPPDPHQRVIRTHLKKPLERHSWPVSECQDRCLGKSHVELSLLIQNRAGFDWVGRMRAGLDFQTTGGSWKLEPRVDSQAAGT